MNYLTLVNKENPIKDKHFSNLELVDYNDVFGKKIQIDKTVIFIFKVKRFFGN